MPKPAPLRIPSDDCLLPVDGVEYALHQGEWIELVPGFTVGDLATLRAVRQFAVSLAAARGEANETDQVLELSSELFSDVIALFCRRLTAWSWTDDAGQPLPPPHGNPAAFDMLRAEELFYLLQAVQGVTPAAAGKGGSNSPTTGSAIARPLSPASRAKARSH